MVQQKKSNTGVVIGMVLLICVLIGVLLYVIVLKKKPRTKPKPTATQESVEDLPTFVKGDIRLNDSQKVADLKRVKALCSDKKLEAEKDFLKALEAIKKLKKDYPNQLQSEIDDLALLVENAQAIAVQKVMLGLEKKAAPLVAKKDFDAAIHVYSRYNGPFRAPTKQGRTQVAKNLKLKKEQVLAQKQKQKAGRKNQFFAKIAASLVKGKHETALESFQKSSFANSEPKLANSLKNLNNIPEIVLKSFEKDIGKTITFEINGNKARGKIHKIKNKTIYAEVKKGKITMIKKVSLKDLDSDEITRRIGEADPIAAGVFAGVKYLKEKDFISAERQFEKTGPLAEPLVKLVAEEKSNLSKTIEKKPVKASKIKAKVGSIDYSQLFAQGKISKKGKKTADDGSIRQTLNVHYSIKNRTLEPISGLKIHFMVIGQSVTEPHYYQVISTSKVNISSLGKKKTFTKKYFFVNNFSEKGKVFGCKYACWLLLIRNSKGKVVFMDTDEDALTKVALSIGRMPEKAKFDLAGKQIKN